MYESSMMELLTFTNVLVTLFAGIISVTLLFYITKFKTRNNNNKPKNKKKSKKFDYF